MACEANPVDNQRPGVFAEWLAAQTLAASVTGSSVGPGPIIYRCEWQPARVSAAQRQQQLKEGPPCNVVAKLPQS